MIPFVRVRWRYAARSGFEVSGDRAALKILAEVLRRHESGDTSEVALETGFDVASYEESMRGLVVRHDNGRVCIVKDSDKVVINGSPHHLRLLAENIEAVADDGEVDQHLHIEYYPDHFFLDERSEPLVVELHP